MQSWTLKTGIRRGLLICGLIAACSALKLPQVSASDLVFAPDTTNFPNMIGLGAGLVPDYEGSDDYTPAAGPLLRLGWDNRYLLLRANSLSANLLDHPVLRLGPTATLHLGRNDVEDAAVDLMEDIDTGLELGLTVGFDFVNQVNERIRFGGDVEIAHDVLDAHGGFLAQASLHYWHPLAIWLDFGLVGGIVYGSKDYNDTYFGVSASDAARSGLSSFSADAGFKDVRLAPMLVAHFSRDWHLGMGVMIKQMLGDAADSPLVDDRGSETQFLAGASVIYSW